MTTDTTTEAVAPAQEPPGGWLPETPALIHAMQQAYGTEYAASWPAEAWNATVHARAAHSARTLPDGSRRVADTPVMPTWLTAAVRNRGYFDVDATAPTLTNLWKELDDWFALAAQHPDDLELTVDSPADAPPITVSQVHAAWSAARDAGSVPLLGMELTPIGPWDAPRVQANINALYVVTRDGAEDLDEQVTTLLGYEPRPAGVRAPVTDAELVEYALWNDDPMGPMSGRVAGWDWLYNANPVDAGTKSSGAAV